MNQQDYEELKMWREKNKKKIQQKKFEQAGYHDHIHIQYLGHNQ